METELRAIRQINGDLRIDDVSDDAPMLKIVFCNEWARFFPDEEKDQILEAVVEKMGKLIEERNAG